MHNHSLLSCGQGGDIIKNRFQLNKTPNVDQWLAWAAETPTCLIKRIGSPFPASEPEAPLPWIKSISKSGEEVDLS